MTYGGKDNVDVFDQL